MKKKIYREKWSFCKNYTYFLIKKYNYFSNSFAACDQPYARGNLITFYDKKTEHREPENSKRKCNIRDYERTLLSSSTGYRH